MAPGEHLLALTLEYRAAIDAPDLLASVGEKYDGRAPSSIAAEYEEVLRAFVTA